MRVRIFTPQNFRISIRKVTYEGSKGIHTALDTAHQSMQPFDMNRRTPIDRIPCFIGYIGGSTAEKSVFQYWRYLWILRRLETGAVGAIKHIFHTAVKYSK